MPPNAKIHSEQAVAAFVGLGWKLKLAFYVEGIDEGYEFLVENVTGSLMQPTTEQLRSCVKLCDVEDRLPLSERGIVVSPGVSKSSDINLVDSDKVVLIKGKQADLYTITTMIGLNLKSLDRPILLNGAVKDDVKVGASVWKI